MNRDSVEQWEAVERLARELMGWTLDDGTVGEHEICPAYWRTPDGEVAGWVRNDPADAIEAWNPFADANADVQVLERAREVWTYDRLLDLGRRLAAVWMGGDEVERRTRGLAHPRQLGPLRYRVGDYARIVLRALDADASPASPDTPQEVTDGQQER